LFINVGRGVAVVDADLVEALKEGHLAGAVIDVCRQEPLPQRHPFWTAWGLLLTGHSSAPTSPSLMVQLFVENLRAYQAGSVARGSGFQPRLLRCNQKIAAFGSSCIDPCRSCRRLRSCV
jgi:phosphoglycerate dehydrogenase-like enzyme